VQVHTYKGTLEDSMVDALAGMNFYKNNMVAQTKPALWSNLRECLIISFKAGLHNCGGL
jgi:hypothetical protein